ncbi:polysaccharide export protein [Pelagibius litoralis]|uniref:Polysaccharide export protein n=1 Tax=Pelagibius litoralis TaxID=374515 RepID=A0A967EUW7_9PROT|nr:polysaccharide biosynthesis/export family protein [Pelagibius litoralis]NIA67652.1 polysaccharide export protein [Pelagibius litoralis]
MQIGGSAGARFLAALALFSLLAGCTGAGSLPALPEAGEGPYQLGAGDRVRLVVFGQEELTGEYLVSDSGYVTVPLVGAVQAEDLTIRQFEEQISSELKKGILVDPNTTAEIVTYRPFYILGETKSPGQYAYVPRMTVLTAVSISGGYTFRADQELVSITRTVDGQLSEFQADPLTYVEPGDVINVYERYF